MTKLREEAEQIVDYLKGSVMEILPAWDRESAADIALDTYTQMLEMEETVLHPYTLGYKMAQQNAKDYIKHESRRRELEQNNPNLYDSVTPTQAPDDPADMLEAEERMKRLDLLTPSLRQTLEDFYIEGLSVKEIAAKDGASESAVKVRLHRAREIIKGE